MSPVIIGLVGGIASGKSTVAALFCGLRPGRTVDADALARRVLARPAVERAITRRFRGAVGPDGSLDRGKLARIVFRNRKALDALEAITHPPIRDALRRAVARAGAATVYLDAPLLQENGLDESCDWVVYVACPARTRRARAQRERGWTEKEHRLRESRQWPCGKKRAHADLVVDNGGGPERARRDVRRALRRIGATTEAV